MIGAAILEWVDIHTPVTLERPYAEITMGTLTIVITEPVETMTVIGLVVDLMAIGRQPVDMTLKEVVLVAAMTVVDPTMTDTERLRDQFNLATITGPKGKCNHLAATEKVQGIKVMLLYKI